MANQDFKKMTSAQLERGRAFLDALRVRTHLFKAEFRDNKDAVLEDLQARYETVDREAREAASTVVLGARTTGNAIDAAWSAFTKRLKETTHVDPNDAKGAEIPEDDCDE